MYGGADRRIMSLVRRKCGIRDGMQDLIDLCERTLSSPVWRGFRRLDYDTDFDRLTFWLLDLLNEEPPSKAITGLWFGIHNPTYPDGRATCGMYLCGSKRFNPSRNVPDWHCRPEYWPEGRYASSEVLKTIYERTARKGELNAQAEVTLCQGFVCLVVRRWCSGPMREKLLNAAKYRGVAAGHDAGDVHLLAILD
jgi:hypothetical protein